MQDHAIVSAALATVVTSLGGSDEILQALLILIVADYVTGMAKSWINDTLNSSKGLAGLYKKAGILVVILVCNMIDKTQVITGFSFRSFIAIAFILNEGISIIENLAQSGVPVPDTVLRKLQQLKSLHEDKSGLSQDEQQDDNDN